MPVRVAADRTARTSAGQRRTAVTLWASTNVRDEVRGHQESAFVKFGRDYVSVVAVPFMVNASEHGFLYRVTLNYRADIITAFSTNHKRVQLRGGGLVLNLLEVNNPGQRSVELVLHCAEA